MSLALTPKRVLDLPLYRDPAFDFLLTFLVERKFKIDPQYTHLSNLVTRLEKFHWRAATPILTHAPGKRHKVDGHEVFHAAIHHLVVCRYGMDVRGMPRLSLLGEALASSANLYFTLVYHRLHGIQHPVTTHWLGAYQKSSKQSGIRFLRRYNDYLRRPFDAFKDCVQEMFSVVWLLLEAAQRRHPDRFRLDPAIEKSVSRSRLYPFYAGYDYSNFILYTLAFCGGSSSRADLAAVHDCRKLLATSSTMLEFLERMALRGIGKRQRTA